MKCPHCGKNIDEVPAKQRMLVVHNSDATSELIERIGKDAGAEVERAKSGKEAQWLLQRGSYGLVVVDVAASEPYAFELVPELKKIPNTQVVLLASVYDKTAYKRRPTSLYGADDYLEQHHLPDKLPVLLAKLNDAAPPKELEGPELQKTREQLRKAADEALEAPIQTPFSIDGDQARMALASAAPEELSQRARELARKLVLDVSLYHADEFKAGVKARDLKTRLKTPIGDAMRFLAERLPAPLTQKDAVAFIEEAVDDVMVTKGGARR